MSVAVGAVHGFVGISHVGNVYWPEGVVLINCQANRVGSWFVMARKNCLKRFRDISMKKVL